jgi:AcrR family transcriptional regulator
MKQDPAQSEARQRIVETALDLFYRQGYLATGINQVIAEAGVSKNTFYYYFKSKEDLCIAYLQERHKLWMGWLTDAIEKNNSPYDRLLSVFDFLESWLKKCDFRGCAFLNIASEVPDINHRLRKEVVGHKDELRKVMRGLLEDLKKSDKTFSKINVLFLSDALYVLFEGVISACQNYGDVAMVGAARKNFMKLLSAA